MKSVTGQLIVYSVTDTININSTLIGRRTEYNTLNLVDFDRYAERRRWPDVQDGHVVAAGTPYSIPHGEITSAARDESICYYIM